MVYVQLARSWTDRRGKAHTAGAMVDVDAITLAQLEQYGVVAAEAAFTRPMALRRFGSDASGVPLNAASLNAGALSAGSLSSWPGPTGPGPTDPDDSPSTPPTDPPPRDPGARPQRSWPGPTDDPQPGGRGRLV